MGVGKLRLILPAHLKPDLLQEFVRSFLLSLSTHDNLLLRLDEEDTNNHTLISLLLAVVRGSKWSEESTPCSVWFKGPKEEGKRK